MNPYAIIGGAAIAFSAGWLVNGWRLGSELTACEFQRDAYGTSLSTQNQAVEKLGKDGADLQGRLDKLLADKTAAEAAKARREAITRLPAPADCNAAFDQWDGVKK